VIASWKLEVSRADMPPKSTRTSRWSIVQKICVQFHEHSFKSDRGLYVARRNVTRAGRFSLHTFYWSSMMKKLAIVFAVGAAALMGGSAYAADNAVKSKPSTDAAQSRIAAPTDISAQYRHRHWHGHHHHHWRHRHYRPYYGSYNYYAPRPYGYSRPYGYYGPRYYGGGPGVTFSFGSGGYRW
jgi:hypothetical protein